MASGIITLTTDFGLDDHYVGVMKGVVSGIHPEAKLIDICHQVRPHNIAHGAFTIAQAYRYFPPGTVHIVVVDPGVGTSRRPILAEAAGHRFVAPDNGVLSQVYERESHVVRTIAADRFALKPTSRTFHGRDVFAPAGAWLSRGKSDEEFGEVIADYVRLPTAAPVRTGTGRWRGRILSIDRFGNLVTSFPLSLLPELQKGFRLAAGVLEVRASFETYDSAPGGEPFVIAGSSGYLEVSIQGASVADLAGIEIGNEVELTLTSPAKA